MVTRAIGVTLFDVRIVKILHVFKYILCERSRCTRQRLLRGHPCFFFFDDFFRHGKKTSCRGVSFAPAFETMSGWLSVGPPRHVVEALFTPCKPYPWRATTHPEGYNDEFNYPPILKKRTMNTSL